MATAGISTRPARWCGRQSRSHTFDPGQRWRTAEGPTENPDLITYQYTGTGRLTHYSNEATATQATYAYDSVGQRTSSEVTVGRGVDQVVTSTDFTYAGLTLHKLSSSKSGGEDPGSWSITYLYDEYGRPYGGLYRDTTDVNPTKWPEPVFFALVTTDRGDVVELLDADGNPFAAYRYDAWGNPLGEGNITAGLWAQETSLVPATSPRRSARVRCCAMPGTVTTLKAGCITCLLGTTTLRRGSSSRKTSPATTGSRVRINIVWGIRSSTWTPRGCGRGRPWKY